MPRHQPSENRADKRAANQATTDYIDIMKKLQEIPSAAPENEEDDTEGEGRSHLLDSVAHSSILKKFSPVMNPLSAPIPSSTTTEDSSQCTRAGQTLL